MNMIKIKPIFNQSAPGVWDIFARIQAAAVVADYNIEWPESQHASVVTEYQRQWRHRTSNFAFGAYDSDSLIGFIRGNISRSEMKIEGLYVLPEYQNLKIGGRLLDAAERAGSLGTGYVSLTARPLAERFYQRHGYHASYSTVYDKSIRAAGRSGAVPVFKLSAPLARIVADMLAPYNISIERNSPAFVYMNADFQLLGVATSKADEFGHARAVIASRAPDNMKNMVERSLNTAIAPFVDR
ncbi:MAG: GNAT family N-acetyltransferase [Muribaculaceae bacterium]|nr:GNAT family N-acetyltransferase [Muribaculaceae bacterium]